MVRDTLAIGDGKPRRVVAVATGMSWNGGASDKRPLP